MTDTVSTAQLCARVEAGIVVEIIDLPAGFPPVSEVYANYASEIFACGATVAQGWTYNGSTFVAPAVIAPTPPSAVQLVAHAEAVQDAKRKAGITTNIGNAATPVIAEIATTDGGIGRVNANVQMIGLATALGMPTPTFAWDNGGGVTLSVTATQMQAMSWAMNSYLQATQNVLANELLPAIAAGTITTTAQIDAAAWPATSF